MLIAICPGIVHEFIHLLRALLCGRFDSSLLSSPLLFWSLLLFCIIALAQRMKLLRIMRSCFSRC
jgi:hypothetical protein